MKTWWQQLRARLAAIQSPLDMRDVLAFGGLAMLSFGVHEIHAPSAWIVGGAALFWLGAVR